MLPSNLLKLKRTPATLRYQAFNPAGTPGCAGFMSRPVTVTGIWDRLTTWRDLLASTTVIDFATAAQADEAFVAFSLGQSPSSDECTGFNDDFGVKDHDQLDVTHQDPPLVGLPDGLRYNVWLKPAGAEYPQYRFGLAGVVQRDRTLVLFGVLSTAEVGPPDVAATSAVLGNVLSRL